MHAIGVKPAGISQIMHKTADHEENRPIPVPGQSIGPSLILVKVFAVLEFTIFHSPSSHFIKQAVFVLLLYL